MNTYKMKKCIALELYKKILILFFMMYSTFAVGQTLKTEKYFLDRSYDFGGWMNLKVDCPGTYQYYYDENDNKIRHGKLICSGNDSKSDYGGAITLKGSYSVVANYSHDTLDGSITIKYSYSIIYGGRTYSNNFLFSGNYKKGVPDGEWKIEETGNLNPAFEFRNNVQRDIFGNAYGARVTSNEESIEKKIYRNVIVKYKDGNIVYHFIKNEWGTSNLTIDDNGLASGYDGDTKIQNSIQTNYYKRKTGERTKIEGKEQEIIKTVVANNGHFNKKDLINQGYMFRGYDWPIGETFSDYVRLLNLDEFDVHHNYEYYPRGSFDTGVGFKREITVYLLERINLTSYDDAVKKIEKDLENPNLYSSNESKIRYYDNTLNSLNDDLKIDGGNYVNQSVQGELVSYLTEKITELKRIEEERRLERERQEKQRRLEEERNKKAKNIRENITTQITQIKKVEQKKQDSDYSSHHTTNNSYYSSYYTSSNSYTSSSTYTPSKSYTSFLNTIKEFQEWEDKHRGYYLSYTEDDISFLERVNNFLEYFIQNIQEGNEVKEIKEKYKTIKADAGKNYSDVADAYKKVYKGYELSPVFNSLDGFDNYVAKIKTVKIEQEKCLQILSLRKEIYETKEKISIEAGKTYSDVADAYKEAYKKYDLIPNFNNIDESISKLKTIKMEQEQCLNFISLRKEITEKQIEIDSRKKECKTIVDVFSKYLKNADVTWGLDSTSLEKLQKIINNQKLFLQAITSSNASELEATVKKMKDKSFENVLKAIAQ